jgi:dTDP-4-dehydrorhamnose 3,5-epimerase
LKFRKTKIEDVFLIEIEKTKDRRGFFARTLDRRELKKHGLIGDFVQCSISFNRKKGTIRGMHFQLPPYEEAKIVTCIKGKIFDVVIDLRKNSPTFKQWEINELNSESHNMVYCPKGVAHGFQTLEDNSEIYYQMSEYYKPKYYRGIRYNDPNFKIRWPLPISAISKNDKNWETLKW